MSGRGAAVPSPDVLAGDAFLWRAVDVFRVAALGYAAVVLARDQEGYRHPVGAWWILAALGVWTAFLLRHRGRSTTVMVTDLGVAVASVLATLLVDDPARVAAGAQTLPAIWPASAVLAWAVWRGWRAGLAAAVVLSVADVVEVGGASASTLNNVVLLLLAGTVVGYAVELYRAGRESMARAVAVEAAAAERERLAGDIHDSVLQVLAYVQRRGAELGGEAGEIGRLAGEQEARLRSLVATGPALSSADGQQDVRAALAGLARGSVTSTGPADPVLLPTPVVDALVAAVGAALDNVQDHAGSGAHAWVLVEDDAGTVRVSVRDDGVGIPPGRLDVAEREGRLGVASSIRRRVSAVGGRAEVTSTPGQGTEVELSVPRPSGSGVTRGRA